MFSFLGRSPLGTWSLSKLLQLFQSGIIRIRWNTATLHTLLIAKSVSFSHKIYLKFLDKVNYFDNKFKVALSLYFTLVMIYCILKWNFTVKSNILFVVWLFSVHSCKGLYSSGIFYVVDYKSWFGIFVCINRELQRIESVTRSPVFSHLSETLSGMQTIRAYR